MTEIIRTQDKRKTRRKEGKKKEIGTCNYRVQSCTSGRTISKSLINSAYPVQFSFHRLLHVGTRHSRLYHPQFHADIEKCLFLFSSSTSPRENSDFTSQSHKSMPELITEARGALSQEASLLWKREKGHFSSQATWKSFPLKKQVLVIGWNGMKWESETMLSKSSGCRTGKERSSFSSRVLRPQEWDFWIYRFLPVTFLQPGSGLPGDATPRIKAPSSKSLSSPLSALSPPPQVPKHSSSLGVQCWYVM